MARAPYLPRVPKGLLFPLSRGVSQDPSRDNTVCMPPQLIITTTSLTAATQFNPYNQSLAATGGITPYTWSLSAGSLPSGLSLSSSGIISGTLGQSSSSSFTVKVTDHVGTTTTKPFTLTVNLATVSGTDSGPNGQTLTVPSTGIVAVASPLGSAFNQAASIASGTPAMTGPSGDTNAQGAVTGSAFTYEATWVVAALPSYNIILAGRSERQWQLYLQANGLFSVGWTDSAGTEAFAAGGPTVSPGTVYQVAITWDGTTVRLFVNGTLAASLSESTVLAPLATGYTQYTVNNQIEVTVDEVRISNIARYTAAYTPATAPFTSDANTGCLYHLDAVQV